MVLDWKLKTKNHKVRYILDKQEYVVITKTSILLNISQLLRCSVLVMFQDQRDFVLFVTNTIIILMNGKFEEERFWTSRSGKLYFNFIHDHQRLSHKTASCSMMDRFVNDIVDKVSSSFKSNYLA